MVPLWRSVAALMRSSRIHVLSVALSACAGAKPAQTRHVAHGHVIAAIEHGDGEAPMMLERVEDEDTVWVELPHFGECPYDAGSIPPRKPIDDGHVPGMSPQRHRQTNMDAGEERIHNEALLGHLDRATKEILTCVSVSACYDTRPLEPGSIDLAFEVAPDGKVRSVDVDLTTALDHVGIRECARVAIWETEFAAFDGADMVVSYRLDID